jgi:hypothetical protein
MHRARGILIQRHRYKRDRLKGERLKPIALNQNMIKEAKTK